MRKKKDNFRLSVLETLAACPDDLDNIKKQLLRSLIRGSKRKKVEVEQASYKAILGHLESICKELRIEEEKDLVERLEQQEKVYKKELYTFVLKHFHDLKNVSETYRLLVSLEEK